MGSQRRSEGDLRVPHPEEVVGRGVLTPITKVEFRRKAVSFVVEQDPVGMGP